MLQLVIAKVIPFLRSSVIYLLSQQSPFITMELPPYEIVLVYEPKSEP